MCVHLDHKVYTDRQWQVPIHMERTRSSVLCSLTPCNFGAAEIVGVVERGQEEYSPTPLTFPAFSPHGRLANQCKCRRSPGPQLAFQRARTTSRDLNKCRCDRHETRESRLSAPHLPPGAGWCTPPRALAVCAERPLRECRGGLGCAPSGCRAKGGPRVSGQREWCEPRHP